MPAVATTPVTASDVFSLMSTGSARMTSTPWNSATPIASRPHDSKNCCRRWRSVTTTSVELDAIASPKYSAARIPKPSSIAEPILTPPSSTNCTSPKPTAARFSFPTVFRSSSDPTTNRRNAMPSRRLL